MVHHGRGLRRLLRDDETAARIEQDYRTAGLEPRRLAMLQYVEKLTRTPSTMTRGDFSELKSHGFSDTDVLHIVEAAAYYAYANRIVEGLGVKLEDG